MVDLLSSPFAIAAVLGGVGFILSSFRHKRRPRRRPEPKLSRQTRATPQPVADPRREADPMAQLARVDWQVKRLMNGAEYRVFEQLEQLVAEAGGGRRIFSQVSLGEILRVSPRSGDRSARASAFNRINAKRVDYLIVDRSGIPVVAIEYQGRGHYQADATARDNIKREAFRLAGVPFVEVAAQGVSDGQRVDLRQILGVGGVANVA